MSIEKPLSTSTFAKLEENSDSKETLVEIIKTDLISQFKICVDDINTEIIIINESNVEQYKELNEVLINLRILDPKWNIDSNLNKPWKFKYMLEGNLRSRILEIDISDLDILDIDGYENFHDALRDLRAEDPGWNINNTRRDFPILLTSKDIGLMNNHLESREK
jgi:hypothetical protein